MLATMYYLYAVSILQVWNKVSAWSVGGCVCLCETIAKPSGGPAFSISWAHLGESIHTVIKCFESMFWIIFSNCLRAIKLPPTNLTLKMRKSESKAATGKDSKYFLSMTSALPIQKLFVPRLPALNSKHFWESGQATSMLSPSAQAATWMSVLPSNDRPSITLLLNAISGQWWRRMSLLILAFVNPRNLIKWIYWREKGQFEKNACNLTDK